MRRSVLTLSCPPGSPPIVSSAPSSLVYECHRRRLHPSDGQRGHSVRVLGETTSCGVPDTLQPKCKKGGRVMPPCGGDGQQGPRTGPTTISRLLQQPLLVPKKSGSLRPVINLKPLNLFIKKEKFKMETTRSIRKALSPGDWVTSIDLKDAYFHIQVHPEFWKYPRIVVGGNVFQFKALPFRLSPAPREFSQVTGVLGTLLHKLTIYLYLAHTQIALKYCPGPGLPGELGQVGIRPDSEVCLPRRGLRSSNWASQAFQGSSSVADIIP